MRLDVDLLQTAARRERGAAWRLIAGLAVFGLGIAVWRIADERDRSLRESLERQRQVALSDERDAADSAESSAASRRRVLEAELRTFPWNDIFRALEAATQATVQRVSINADRAVVEIDVQSVSAEQGLAYGEQLAGALPEWHVHVARQSHEPGRVISSIRLTDRVRRADRGEGQRR